MKMPPRRKFTRQLRKSAPCVLRVDERQQTIAHTTAKKATAPSWLKKGAQVWLMTGKNYEIVAVDAVHDLNNDGSRAVSVRLSSTGERNTLANRISSRRLDYGRRF